MSRYVLLFALLVLLPTGCATLFGTRSVPVSFNSNPQGADVVIGGNSLGTTPVTVNLSNHVGHTVVLRLEGYQDFTCTLETSVGAKWVILDILAGGLVPIIVDAATGQWKELQTDVCNATLSVP